MKKLSEQELVTLQEALAHMHIAELENQLKKLNLSIQKFNQKELIERLMHYASTGQELASLKLSVISQVKHDASYPLHENRSKKIQRGIF